MIFHLFFDELGNDLVLLLIHRVLLDKAQLFETGNGLIEAPVELLRLFLLLQRLPNHALSIPQHSLFHHPVDDLHQPSRVTAGNQPRRQPPTLPQQPAEHHSRGKYLDPSEVVVEDLVWGTGAPLVEKHLAVTFVGDLLFVEVEEL